VRVGLGWQGGVGSGAHHNTVCRADCGACGCGGAGGAGAAGPCVDVCSGLCAGAIDGQVVQLHQLCHGLATVSRNTKATQGAVSECCRHRTKVEHLSGPVHSKGSMLLVKRGLGCSL
jgi:hypothetical protein